MAQSDTQTTPTPAKRLQQLCVMPMLIVLTAVLLVFAGGNRAAIAKANSRAGKTEDSRLKAALETIAEKTSQKEAAQMEKIKAALTPLEQQWGIQMKGLQATAAGYMLDFRFRVVDKEKAFPLLSRRVKRYVVVEKSGAVLRIPFTDKVGSLRATVRTPNMIKENRIYGSLFANPGQHVKPGDKVTNVIGNFLADQVTVQ